MTIIEDDGYFQRPSGSSPDTGPDSIVQVVEASQLAPPLSSDKTYIIYGVIDLTSEGISLEVPEGGLFIKGLLPETSKIICSDDNYTMFTSPVAGSGDLYIESVTITTDGTSSRVYNIEDLTGTKAFECTFINYSNCTSLGTVKGYRQGLEFDSARFGGSPELTLEGSWNGFRVSTALVRGVSNITSLFKAGAGFTLSSRFLTDINCDLPATGALLDFSEANLLEDELLQLSGATITRQGVADPSDTLVTPNITATSVKSKFFGNFGIPNTKKYLRASNTVETTTTITTPSVFVPLVGTYVVEKSSHMAEDSNGVYEFLTGFGLYSITIDLSVDGNPGQDLTVRLVRSVDGGSTYPDQVLGITRTVNNLTGGRDVAFFTVSDLFEFRKGDLVRLEVANESGTDNVTLELGGYITIVET